LQKLSCPKSHTVGIYYCTVQHTTSVSLALTCDLWWPHQLSHGHSSKVPIRSTLQNHCRCTRSSGCSIFHLLFYEYCI